MDHSEVSHAVYDGRGSGEADKAVLKWASHVYLLLGDEVERARVSPGRSCVLRTSTIY